MSFDYVGLMTKTGIDHDGITIPSAFEVPSRSSLYFDVQILSVAIPCEIPFGTEHKGVLCLMGFKSHDFFCEDGLMDWIRISAVDFFLKKGIITRAMVVDETVMVMCAWSMRDQFRLSMIDFLESVSFRTAVWPTMAHDFGLDVQQLNAFESRTSYLVLAIRSSRFFRKEIVWKFAHFTLIQRRGERGYRWLFELGSNTHLLDVIERTYRRQRSSGCMDDIDIFNGALSAVDAEDGCSTTWISENVELHSKDFSLKSIRAFFNYLRVFVNSIYLGSLEDQKIAEMARSSRGKKAPEQEFLMSALG